MPSAIIDVFDRQFLLLALLLIVIGAAVRQLHLTYVGWRARRLRQQRQGESFATFAAALPSIEAAVAHAVYDAFLYNWWARGALPVRPSDRLWRDRVVDVPEELAEDFIPEILAQLKFERHVDPAELEGVSTVADVAAWVQAERSRRPA